MSDIWLEDLADVEVSSPPTDLYCADSTLHGPHG